jgi:hypothetical protein
MVFMGLLFGVWFNKFEKSGGGRRNDTRSIHKGFQAVDTNLTPIPHRSILLKL